MEAVKSVWRCAVPVATVWTTQKSARPIDDPGIRNPVNLMKWLEALPYQERLDLCDANRVQTQVLYGEEIIVEEIDEGWAKILAPHQPTTKNEKGYPGWVPLSQITETKELMRSAYVIVTADKVQLWKENGEPFLVLPFNTVLPLKIESEKFYHVDTPHGAMMVSKWGTKITTSQVVGNQSTMEQAVQLGLAFLDLPYLWGGMSSYGYDCSGFTYNMAKAVGVLLPRDAGDQKKAGKAISKHHQKDWQMGDLLLFANDHGKASSVRHVGFYFGDGKMLHSPKTGKSVEIITLAGTQFEEELCGVGRYQAKLG
jgi:cell wall-associated NlpC family hydrolase